jgi:hypothetical protein
MAALVIWQKLALVSDPASDTFAVRDQVFSRVSHDPDLHLELKHSGPGDLPGGLPPG